MSNRPANEESSGVRVRWLDADEISANEDHVRIDQSLWLQDVLELVDNLTEIFVPEIESGPVTTPNGQVAALQALEAGLFGHVRSVRAAIVDGRVQEVIMLGRTIEEIRKRAYIAVARPDIADKMTDNAHFSMKRIGQLYEEIHPNPTSARENLTTPTRNELTDKQSWVIHARHRGLQFQIIEREGAATILRTPRAPHLSDRGRDIAFYVLAVATEAAQVLVPPLLEAFHIPRAEWDRRHAIVAGVLDDEARSHGIAALLRRALNDDSIAVGIAGSVTRAGKLMPVDEVLLILQRLMSPSGDPQPEQSNASREENG